MKGGTKEKEKEKEVELEVGAEDLVKVEEEGLGPSTPLSKEAEQQEEVEKMVRSKETAQEEKESLGPSTPTHLNQDSRAGLDYDQAVIGKHRSVDTGSPTPIVKGHTQVTSKTDLFPMNRNSKLIYSRTGYTNWQEESPSPPLQQALAGAHKSRDTNLFNLC